MLSPHLANLTGQSLDLQSWLAMAGVVCTLGFAWALGRIMLPGKAAGGTEWVRLPFRLVVGLAVSAALGALWGLGRMNYLSLLAIAPMVSAVWYWRQLKPVGRLHPLGIGEWKRLAIALGFVLTWTWIFMPMTGSDGHLVRFNDDLGYYAQAAKSLPGAGVACVWTAALGEWCRAAGETADVWYHWGPIWLVSGLSRLFNLPEMIVLLRTVAPVLGFALLLMTAHLARQLTDCSAGWSLIGGAASLIAVTVPSMSEPAWLARWVPGNALPHFHPSLAYQFSYQFEALLVLGALAAILEKRTVLGAMLLFLAGVSAPHTVAGVGLIAATLGGVAILLRRWWMLRLSIATVGVLILAWACVHYVFGVDMPKSEGSQFIDLRPSALLKNAGLGLRDSAVALLLALPLIPGFFYWHRHGRCELSRHLGWVAFSALLGSSLAYQMLLPEGDRSHFTMYAHAIWVVPIGVWGLVGWCTHGKQRVQSISAWLLIAVTAVGLYESRGMLTMKSPLPVLEMELSMLRGKIGKTRWGYFAERDRNWWIPQEATLAALLDSQCLRLNELPKLDRESDAAKFYGAGRISGWVPRGEGESDIDWSLRLAAAMGIVHVVETDSLRLPPGLKSRCKEVLTLSELRVYRLPDPASPVP